MSTSWIDPLWTRQQYAAVIEVGDNLDDPAILEHVKEDGCLWIGPFNDEFAAMAFITNPENVEALDIVSATVVPCAPPKSKWDIWD